MELYTRPIISLGLDMYYSYITIVMYVATIEGPWVKGTWDLSTIFSISCESITIS